LASGLLHNDALILAVMQANGLTNLASHDADFDRVPGILRYAPAESPAGRGMPRMRQIPRAVPRLMWLCRGTGAWDRFETLTQTS